MRFHDSMVGKYITTLWLATKICILDIGKSCLKLLTALRRLLNLVYKLCVRVCKRKGYRDI